MTRQPVYFDDGSKSKKPYGTPFSSRNPENNQWSILDFYFGHPTSSDPGATYATESPEGNGRTGGAFDDQVG